MQLIEIHTEMRTCTRDEPKVGKPKKSNETSPQEQGEASPKPARRSTSLNDKKSRPSLLERASKKLLEEKDHKDVSGHFKSYTM